MADRIDKLTANQQGLVLRRLKQGAVASLLGMASRTLRDHNDAPRNPDDTYDARELVKWAAGNVDAAELSDEEVEQVQIAVEYGTDYDYSRVVVADLLKKIEADYGVAGLLAYIRVFIKDCEQYREWTKRDMNPSRAQIEEQERQKRESRMTADAEQHLRIAIVCAFCDKRRLASKWVAGGAPLDYHDVGDTCPACAAKSAS